MKFAIKDLLACPECKSEFDWVIDEQTQERILFGNAFCKVCDFYYPIKEGIGIFLTKDNNYKDYWEGVESNLSVALKKDNDLKKKLMESKIESLNPADLFLRGMVLNEWGEFEEAKKINELAIDALYGQSYNRCYQNMKKNLLKYISDYSGPIVDFASGMGGLVPDLMSFSNELIISDISPTVLIRNKRRFQFFNYYNNISLLAFDVKKMPFKNNSIKLGTTNLGLSNIQDPLLFSQELGRVVSGKFFAINYFFDQNDFFHKNLSIELKLPLSFKEETADFFKNSGFNVEFVSECRSKASPTPVSKIFNIKIDMLPAKETEISWSLVRCIMPNY